MAATLAGLVFSMGLYTEFDGQPTGETFTWLNIQNTAFNFTFQLDKLAFLMLFVVHLVALLVQVFSMNYMAHDAYRWRYFAFLQLFIFSMLGVVLAADLLLMYVFWELVGLSSYLLIGFWYAKPRAAWAAQKAFLLNRVGDAGFLMGILLLLANGQSTHFESLSIGLPLPSTAVGLLLFCGVVGKSAQWPLSTWLPDAMEGPTPVSALIHAATMVAAGIFLLARIHFLLTPQALLVVAGIGTITMLLGAYQAVFQNDIKKMLAYSTVSQLGLMVLAMGIGAREASLFHLLTHAFFKAGLFLSAGAIIHHLHTQDVR
ncbi:MAG: NADH-quinone oxidoreductase subunit M, partial [Runella slithyformis]